LSTSTFATFNRQLIELLDAKENIQAFELVEKAQAAFLDHIYHITYWRISVHALTGKQEEALQIFRETLESGGWFPPNLLLSDPGFASLQSLPAFQEMVEVCRLRIAEFQAKARPELLVRQPIGYAGTLLSLLIGLHGNGDNASKTIEYWSGIATHDWLLAIPQSSQLERPDAYVWDDRELSVSEIREHLAKLTSEYSIDSERVVLGGFSMGGGQAIWMALHQSIKTSGFVVLGPWLREAELEALSALLETQKPAGLRGYILVGEEDRICLDVSHKVVEIIHAHNLPCELEVIPGLDHSYPEDFAKCMISGLAFIEQR